MENVRDFVASLAEFEKSDEKGEKNLSTFLSNLALDQQTMHGKKKRKGDCVQLMTFHSAKGLEFPACFLVGLEDHIIPHEKSLKEGGLDEERRLMYVAMTRAMRHLTLSMAQTRQRMGKESVSRPSRFLFEIPKDFLKATDWRYAH